MRFRGARPNSSVHLALIALILAISCIGSYASAVPRRSFRVVHLRRIPQDPTPSLPIATGQDVRSTATFPAPTGESTETMTASATATNTDSRKQETVTSSIAMPDSTGSSNNTTDPSTRQVYTGGLPLKPSITPASIIAGIFMMTLGFFYCFAGVRFKRVYIFVSLAFLCSAAVSALIVYMMNPPTKAAVFVGYVIAAIATGFVCGAIGVLFPEITGNLACLFGGFCLAMWILCLKPGGLIEPLFGKIILIVGLCVGMFALSFHPVTNPYVLIFSLAFGGSVVGVLGVDCFVRAGLKEMWIYLWELNEKIFPYQTNTYPHTRGIKLELGITAVVAIFGILAHLKFWTTVEKRREKKERERLEHEEAAKTTDEEIGRRVEQIHQQEKQDWEAKHGEVNMKEKSLDGRRESGSVSLGSNSLGALDSNRDNGAIEQPSRAHVSRMVDLADSDAIREIRPPLVKDEEYGSAYPLIPGGYGGNLRRASEQTTPSASRRESGRSSMEMGQMVVPEESSPLASVTPTPEVIPVQLEHQQEEKLKKQSSKTSTIIPWVEKPRNSRDVLEEDQVTRNRESLMTDTFSLATAGNYDDSVSDYAPSSRSGHSRSGSSSSIQPENIPLPESLAGSNRASSGTLSNVPGLRTSLLEPTDEPVIAPLSTDTSTLDDTRLSTSPGTRRNSAAFTTSSPPSAGSKGIHSSTAALQHNLVQSSVPKGKGATVEPSAVEEMDGMEVQNHCSKIVKVYRTNEWAKHLGQAEEPELEDLDRKHDSAEIPAPLDLETLQQTADYIARPLGQKTPASIPKTRSNVAPLHIANSARSPSALDFKSRAELSSRKSPQHNRPHTRRPSDTPSQSTSPTSPISPTSATRTPSGLGLYPPPNDTLLSKRANIVRTRNSSAFDQFRSFSTGPLISEIPHPPRRSSTPMEYPSTAVSRAQSPFHVLDHPPPIPPRSPSRNKMSRNSSLNTLHMHTRALSDDMTLAERQQVLTGLQSGLRQYQSRRSPAPLSEGNVNPNTTGAIDQTEQERRAEERAGRMREKDMLERHREHMRRMQRQASRLL